MFLGLPARLGIGTKDATVLAMAPLTRRLMLLLVAGGLTAACLSPTLPLPPPSRPSVEGPDQNGMVTLEGSVPGSAVYAANQRTGEIAGQFTEPDGYYKFQIGAEQDDELVFWYSEGTQNSPSIVIQVH